LLGLADESATVRDAIFAFWDNPAHLSDGVVRVHGAGLLPLAILRLFVILLASLSLTFCFSLLSFFLSLSHTHTLSFSFSVSLFLCVSLSLFLSFSPQTPLLTRRQCGRLNTMFSSLFSPRVESAFLQSTSHLMLSLVAKSPDFDRPLFEAPLSASDWKAYSIDASLRMPVFATPLFAATQLGSASGTQAQMAAGRVRTTQQDLAFSQTQTQDPAAHVRTTRGSGLCIIPQAGTYAGRHAHRHTRRQVFTHAPAHPCRSSCSRHLQLCRQLSSAAALPAATQPWAAPAR
jgi:hypothetical protein